MNEPTSYEDRLAAALGDVPMPLTAEQRLSVIAEICRHQAQLASEGLQDPEAMRAALREISEVVTS